MKKIALFIYLLASSFLLHAGAVEKYFQYHQQQQALPLLKSTSVKTGYFDQYIDPKRPKLGTFKQRYYLDEVYAKDANAPVFFYVCGEAACSQSSLSGAIRSYARRYQARLIALEHRFYGKSQPFNDLSTNHLRYLTIENALADLASFQKAMTQKHGWSGKWVSFGGSYPGSLSAYYRLHYPDLVVGAIASSAPVRAQESFPEYDKHVTKVAGPECAKAMRKVVKIIDKAQTNKQKFAEIKAMFSASDVVDDIDFIYLVADIGAGAIQYGMHDEFCHMLTSGEDELTGYAQFANILYSRFGENAVDMTAQAAESESLDNSAEGIGMRQWFYQSCLEYGYWQVAHPDPSQSTRSKQIDLDYHHQICFRLFNMTTPAKVDLTNETFFTPLLSEETTHLVFTNGSNDPWSMLSITPDSEWATNPSLIYELIEGSAHCDDLHAPRKADSIALKLARERTKAALDHWLY
ncbi:S28 family serine protease [Legionella sp. W05-934-2]|jgi:pimeloyl-ACP methyl ester carboxylesterase|uniref:S28 family serine protease n=1 Tax=Legionella sp. W05-934-2 TaxID=1198649 RepID=UPI0034636C35